MNQSAIETAAEVGYVPLQPGDGEIEIEIEDDGEIGR